MNTNLRTIGISALLGLGSALPSVTAATIIDDFTDGSQSEYSLTRVNDTLVAVSNVSFSSSTGGLVASYSGTTAVEQLVLLRNDFTLGIGQTLTVDVSQATSTSDSDFGIAVANTVAPTSASVSDTDTRDTFAWAAVYVRPNQNAVRSTFGNTATVVTGAGVLAADETTVSKLWITRNTATEFKLGYTNTSNAEFTSQTVTFTSSSDVGNAIGFYADLRANGGTLGSLDNLTVIPEPSAALLGGLGVLGLLRRRRN